ncbi:MAG: Trk system potassium transporter TrkA [Nitrospina sp.]|nr:Trk system potassium transporter TrkA [Nitrospinota bacterium]TDJ60108.1 MAG: Trk system potassium transporter TrkA [Nitrospina sp.]
MNILIVGAGIVGFNLAQELSHEGHDISIIDADPEKIKLISEKLDVLAVRGNGCLPSTLIQGRIRDAEMVIAVTDKDEINLMVCFLAHKFEVKERFARLRNMELTGESQVFKPEELFVDHAINPAEIIIDSILKIIKTPGAVNVAEFANGQIFFRGFDVPADAPLAGKTIEEIREVCELNAFLVVAIVREGKMIIPKYENRIQAGDKIYVLVDHDFLPLILPMLNRQVDEIQKIIIYGASQIAVHLARELNEFISDVSIIEPSLEKANEAADTLEDTVILHGSGTDPDLFNDINMKDADLFLALSNNDEMNILSALLAKKHGAKRAAVITNDPDYLPILDSIGIDVTINPRLITVSEILKHLRKGQVVNLYKLIEGEAEVLEIVISAESAAAGRLINQLHMPEHSIIGAVLRVDGEMVVPGGSTEILEGDTVIVVTLPDCIGKIEKIFGKKSSFFS